MARLVVTSVLFFWTLVVFAQSDTSAPKNLRLIHKNHFGLGFGGPGFFGPYYEHFFTENWSIETGFGTLLVINSAYVGGRYYFGEKDKLQRFSPYVGAAFGAGFYIGGGGSGGIDGAGTPIGYVPVGIQFLSRKGYAFSLETALLYFDGEYIPMGALKIRLLKKKKKKPTKIENEKNPKSSSFKKNRQFYSMGINLSSFINPNFVFQVKPDLFFASNPNFDFFVQKEISSKYALRFPARIGLNANYDWESRVNQDVYRNAKKTIIADLGFEPLFYVYRNKNLSGYIAPSMSVGIGRKIRKEYFVSELQGDYKYTSGGTYSYAKFGFSMGAQWALTKFLHLGMEYGGYVANNYYSTTTGVGDFGQKYYGGLFGKYFLVCQLGARK
jgi:hypothetical protein